MRVNLSARRLLGVFVVAAVGASLAVMSSPANAVVDIPVSRVDVSDVNPYEAISHKSGAVTVSGCSTAATVHSTKTVSATGAVLGTTPNVAVGTYTLPAISLCDGQKAVGKDGSLYGSDPTQLNTEGVVRYTQTGVKKWTRYLGVPGCESGNLLPQWIRTGGDGNIYVVGWPYYNQCSSQRQLYSFTPAGVLRWQVALGTAHVTFANTYRGNGGGVVLLSGSMAKYYGHDGLLKGETVVAGNNPTGVSSNAAGMLVVVTYGEAQAAACGWSSARSVVTSISGYTIAGRTLFYEPSCTYAHPVVALSNGGVAYGGDGYVDSVNRIVKLTYNATTGATTANQLTVWPMSDGYRTFTPGVGIIAETNGNMLTYRRYTREGGKYYGTQFTLVRTSDGARSSTFNTDALGADKTIIVEEETVAIAPGILHFVARECGGWSCSTLDPQVLYSVPMVELGMDYPRGHTLGVAKVTIDKMVVMGDSFSSGLGSLAVGYVYEDATCQRTPTAYGHNIDSDPSVRLQMPANAFLACAGAETEHVYNTRFKGRAPQLDKLPADATSIFMTIGGNDAKFARLAALCIFLDCSTQAFRDEFNGHLNGLDGSLAEVYAAVLTKAQGAHLYAMDYPYMMPTSECGNAGSGTWWDLLRALRVANPSGYEQAAVSAGLTPAEATQAKDIEPVITEAELVWIRSFQASLNGLVADGVAAANAATTPTGRAHYVDVNQEGSPFAGHDLCSNDPHFNGVNELLPPGSTFHPTAHGQVDYYELARSALAAHQPQYVTAS